VTTSCLFFLAEMGDKTQIATFVLAARYHSIIPVLVGSTLGMLASDVLVLVLGEGFARRISRSVVRWASAGLFFGFGIISLLTLISR
jgi:putative Ca2+/H+ antiporter (TMEM165/GDT1 family)